MKHTPRVLHLEGHLFAISSCLHIAATSKTTIKPLCRYAHKTIAITEKVLHYNVGCGRICDNVRDVATKCTYQLCEILLDL